MKFLNFWMKIEMNKNQLFIFEITCEFCHKMCYTAFIIMLIYLLTFMQMLCIVNVLMFLILKTSIIN